MDALDMLVEKQGNCRLFSLYEERINIFREDPPGQDWDGVFVHTSK